MFQRKYPCVCETTGTTYTSFHDAWTRGDYAVSSGEFRKVRRELIVAKGRGVTLKTTDSKGKVWSLLS